MLTAYVALAPEYPGFDLSALLRVAAAIQKQVARDVGPIWEVNATVSAFARLEDVPIGYWPVIVTTRDLGGQDGTHLDDDGSPYALVEADAEWSLTASHECIEMILDPFGNRTVPASSPREDQGRVELLVEACDPCQNADTAYAVNDVLVADFVTPDYFEMSGTPGALAGTGTGVRYCYSGKITRPREVLAGGYLCWRDPATREWWQRSNADGKTPVDTNLGALEAAARGQRSLREILNSYTQHHDRASRHVTAELSGRLRDRAALGGRASQGRAASLRHHAHALPPLAKPPVRGGGARVLESPQTRRAVPSFRDAGAELDRAIALLQTKPDLPDCARVLATLQAAKAQWSQASGTGPVPTAYPEAGELALVQSALRTPLVAPHASLLTGRGIVGFEQYDNLDLRWLATLWNHIFRPVAPFPVAPLREVVVGRLEPGATIALAGDWGTGNLAASRTGALIAKANPTYTVHLGDVYYSGLEGEVTDNLLSPWPAGSAGSFTLNGNHEMYGGDEGYFGVALASAKFAAQGGFSYFALANDDWVLLGLDSAYGATKFYQDGALNQPQVDWLAALAAAGSFTRRDGTRKRVLLLTHHPGIDASGAKKSPGLWDQVTSALGGGPDYWYWGHLHGVAVFKPVTLPGITVNARLLGHGGVPYVSDPATPALAWTESGAPADLLHDDGPARSRNGYALLRLDGRTLHEEIYDELGARRWSSG